MQFPIKHNKMNKYILTLTTLGLLLISSCRTPHQIAYMQDWENGEIHEAISAGVASLRAQPDDKLSIAVSTDNPQLSESLNLPTFSHRIGRSNYISNPMNTISQSETMSLYTVDANGNIDFPLIGTIHIGGMTRNEIADYVTKQLEDGNIARNPVVTVEWANAGVTIVGEVSRPGLYQLSRDVTTLPQALGMAGDLTIQGRRDNILVVREENGKTISYRVDMTDGDKLLSSPVYYVKQNDYIYVEPNNMKKRTSTVNGNNVLSASFWVSIASLLTSIAVLVFK